MKKIILDLAVTLDGFIEERIEFKLITSNTFKSGVVQLIYKPLKIAEP